MSSYGSSCHFSRGHKRDTDTPFITILFNQSSCWLKRSISEYVSKKCRTELAGKILDINWGSGKKVTPRAHYH